MTSVVVWLNCYAYTLTIWIDLITVYQLKNIFLKKSICHKKDHHWITWKKIPKTITKVKKIKIRTVLFDEKRLQKFNLTGEVRSVWSYYIIILCLQSQYLVLELVKLRLTVVNFLLGVVPNYLTKLKKC